MSEAKHTPGPWDIRQDIPYSTAGWVVFHGYHEENKTVCRLSHGSTVPPVHDKAYLENKANAQLIAAAPDMLAALKAAQGNGVDDDPKVWSQISHAILKAEGRA